MCVGDEVYILMDECTYIAQVLYSEAVVKRAAIASAFIIGIVAILWYGTSLFC